VSISGVSESGGTPAGPPDGDPGSSGGSGVYNLRPYNDFPGGECTGFSFNIVSSGGGESYINLTV
jgi:hypothetical protein